MTDTEDNEVHDAAIMQLLTVPAPQTRSPSGNANAQDGAHANLGPCWTRVGLVLLLGTGVGLGLGLPSEGNLPWPANRVAQVAGWLYFAAWSLSFYPQLIINHQRKSVVGFSLDFAVINFVGFLCLSVYYSSLAWNASVRQDYRQWQKHGSDSSVRANDAFFALHAAALTALTLLQCAVYDRGQQKVSLLCRCVVAVIVAVVCMRGMLVLLRSTSVLGWLYMLSYIKVGITVSKYIPQVLLNMRRRSTVGWSVQQVLLDCFGGVLSMFQLLLEATVLQDLSLVTGDLAKVLLALVSIGYDAILAWQHFILYPDPKPGSQLSRNDVKHTKDDENGLLRPS